MEELNKYGITNQEVKRLVKKYADIYGLLGFILLENSNQFHVVAHHTDGPIYGNISVRCNSMKDAHPYLCFDLENDKNSMQMRYFFDVKEQVVFEIKNQESEDTLLKIVPTKEGYAFSCYTHDDLLDKTWEMRVSKKGIFFSYQHGKITEKFFYEKSKQCAYTILEKDKSQKHVTHQIAIEKQNSSYLFNALTNKKEEETNFIKDVSLNHFHFEQYAQELFKTDELQMLYQNIVRNLMHSFSFLPYMIEKSPMASFLTIYTKSEIHYLYKECLQKIHNYRKIIEMQSLLTTMFKQYTKEELARKNFVVIRGNPCSNITFSNSSYDTKQLRIVK